MDSIQNVGPGVFAIDSGYVRPLMDAIHLVVHEGRAALIDTGTRHSMPRVMAALSAQGLDGEAVDWVMLTHVHLDHAGGAGTLMQHFPHARLAVHGRGARHIVDPSKLWAGTVAVYGETNAKALYGELVSVDEERVVIVEEGMELPLGVRETRRFRVLDTPGHAKHHVCYFDPVARGWFTGDTFGLSYRELDLGSRAFIFPTTTPVHFDPESLHDSIERLLRADPSCMYLTHYSAVRDVHRMAKDLHRLLDEHVKIAQKHIATPPAKRHAGIAADIAQLVSEEAARSGWALQGQAAIDIYAGDIDLNAQGLVVWLDGAA